MPFDRSCSGSGVMLSVRTTADTPSDVKLVPPPLNTVNAEASVHPCRTSVYVPLYLDELLIRCVPQADVYDRAILENRSYSVCQPRYRPNASP